MPVTGVLREIGLFPVKSAGGLAVGAVRVEEAGLVGDRGFAVVDAAGEVLRAKRVPRLGELVVTGPADDPRLEVPGDLSLAQFLDVPGAHVARVEGGARQVEAVHLVTRRQRDTPGAGDTSRANLVVEFPVVEIAVAEIEVVGFADEPPASEWLGARVSVGALELEVVSVPRHCAGVFAQVVAPGQVRLGDAVRLSVGGLD